MKERKRGRERIISLLFIGKEGGRDWEKGGRKGGMEGERNEWRKVGVTTEKTSVFLLVGLDLQV